jgi:hypothetical protein
MQILLRKFSRHNSSVFLCWFEVFFDPHCVYTVSMILLYSDLNNVIPMGGTRGWGFSLAIAGSCGWVGGGTSTSRNNEAVMGHASKKKWYIRSAKATSSLTIQPPLFKTMIHFYFLQAKKVYCVTKEAGLWTLMSCMKTLIRPTGSLIQLPCHTNQINLDLLHEMQIFWIVF